MTKIGVWTYDPAALIGVAIIFRDMPSCLLREFWPSKWQTVWYD